MEQLELKHLTPYLLVNLKIYDSYDDKISDLVGIVNGYREEIFIKDNSIKQRNIEEIKPILRPLSDINSFIIHNKCEINPIKYFLKEFNELDRYTEYMSLYNLFGSHVSKLRFDAIQKLHEWKFDTQGLIEKGLAIDVNLITPDVYS